MLTKGKTMRIGGFISYIKSPEFIAVASAIIVTPMVASFLLPLIRRIPVIGSHPTGSVLVAALVVFIIGKWLRGALIRAILIGVSGGLVINALMATSFGQRFVGRISSTVSSATS